MIHTENKASSPAGVLFELKRQRNTAEMISPANLNVKALHELVLYFMRERTDDHNTDIKYLVATNFEDWFVFDAAEFVRVFYKNKTFLSISKAITIRSENILRWGISALLSLKIVFGSTTGERKSINVTLDLLQNS